MTQSATPPSQALPLTLVKELSLPMLPLSLPTLLPTLWPTLLPMLWPTLWWPMLPLWSMLPLWFMLHLLFTLLLWFMLSPMLLLLRSTLTSHSHQLHFHRIVGLVATFMTQLVTRGFLMNTMPLGTLDLISCGS